MDHDNFTTRCTVVGCLRAAAASGRRSRALLRALWADRRGASAVLTMLAATVLMGFAGLGIDVASWEVTQRRAVDQAAIGAVVAYLAGGGDSTTSQAKGITASYGFTDGQKGVTVSVNQITPSRL
jgi:Flp pilus assembly protein TadG